MFQNEAGIKVYESGDVVRVGQGKVDWTVKFADKNTVSLVNESTGRKRMAEHGDLTLIHNIRDYVTQDVTVEELTSEEPKAEHGDLEHTPGESPNAYKERTGQKLDGRTTRYGRAVLAALQRKAHVFEGKGRGKRKG